jgi:hypothetical protein
VWTGDARDTRPMTSLTAVQHHTRFWGNSRHGGQRCRPCAHIAAWSGDPRRPLEGDGQSADRPVSSKHGTTEVPRPAARRHVHVDLPIGVRRPRPRGSGLRATGHSPTVPGAHKGAQFAQPWVLSRASNTRIGLCFSVRCRTSPQPSGEPSSAGVDPTLALHETIQRL